MKYFDWDPQKNKELKEKRGVSFEEVMLMLKKGDVLDLFDHPNQTKYPGQKIFIVKINNYCFMVPYIEDSEKYFLKTVIPSRKATKKYLFKK